MLQPAIQFIKSPGINAAGTSETTGPIEAKLG